MIHIIPIFFISILSREYFLKLIIIIKIHTKEI